MTIQEFLSEQGLTAEEIAAVAGNEKQSKAMTAALQRYEEGLTAKQQADAEKQETQNFWESKTKDLEQSVGRLTAAEKKAAQEAAERARIQTYLKSLAEQGYDVPKDMYEGAAKEPPRDPATGQYMTRDEVTTAMRGVAPDLVTLTALQARYQYLLDKPYIDIDKDFAEAQKAGKPLSEYVSAKYNFVSKEAEKNQKAEQARIDALVEEKYKTKEAELVAKYGTNHELATPMPSKFTRLETQQGFKNDSWKTREGRKANREQRLKRFENVPLQ